MEHQTDTRPIVTIKIRTGPVTPAQKTAWRKFWQKVIVEVKTSER